MKLLDIVNGPWAIQPENLAEIQGIYTTHLRGDKIDIAAIEARLGRPLANEQQQYSICKSELFQRIGNSPQCRHNKY